MSRIIQVAVPKHLGDAVLALPALRSLAALPDTTVTIVSSSALVLDLLAEQGPWRRSPSFATAANSIAVLLAPSFRVALQARVARIDTIVGLASDRRGLLISHVVPDPDRPLPRKGLPSLLVGEHQQRSYQRVARFTLDLLGSSETDDDGARGIYQPGQQACEQAASLWQSAGRPGVLFHPFARGLASKRWPLENWQILGRELQGRGERILVTGGPGAVDAKFASAVADDLGTPCSAGSTRVVPEVWVALAGLCQQVVLCDTGLAHLSAAAGLDPIVLFGSTDPKRHAPSRGRVLWNGAALSCAPCYKDRCSNAEGQLCMEQDPHAVARLLVGEAGSSFTSVATRL
jgi:heptosyltransferase II